MATQKSFIKLEGKIGDLTFYKTKNGYQAREKGGVSADRIKNDPSYQRTRENNAEFGIVTTASKKMRDALRSVILNVNDAKMSIRLNSRFFRIIKADAINLRGERKVLTENTALLKDFNFNEAAQLNNTLYAAWLLEFDRQTGLGKITIPSIRPEVAVVSPVGATHFRYNIAGVAINFDEEEGSVLNTEDSIYQDLKSLTTEMELSITLPAASNLPILIVFGILFYQEVNGSYYPLNNGGYNALSVIAVNLP